MKQYQRFLGVAVALAVVWALISSDGHPGLVPQEQLGQAALSSPRTVFRGSHFGSVLQGQSEQMAPTSLLSALYTFDDAYPELVPYEQYEQSGQVVLAPPAVAQLTCNKTESNTGSIPVRIYSVWAYKAEAERLIKDALAKQIELQAWLDSKICAKPCVKTTTGPTTVIHIDPVYTNPSTCPSPPSPAVHNLLSTKVSKTSCVEAEASALQGLIKQMGDLANPCAGSGCSRYSQASNISMACTTSTYINWLGKKKPKYIAVGKATITITCGKQITETFPTIKGWFDWGASYTCAPRQARITPESS
ncbi:MAG: hypothetical protein U9M92_01620 [Patescibacteria group bacterium]|nr:hypothetical protein [Patescibacteria group bacterium]